MAVAVSRLLVVDLVMVALVVQVALVVAVVQVVLMVAVVVHHVVRDVLVVVGVGVEDVAERG